MIAPFKLARRLLQSSPEVLAFRVRQRVALGIARRSGFWQRFDGSPQGPAPTGPAVLLNERGLDRARALLAGNPTLREALATEADAIHNRTFRLFGTAVPQRSAWAWDADWRFGKQWPNGAAFKFYEPRQQPYDVKFPWELSRLSWLVQLLQAALLLDEPDYARDTLQTLAEWRTANPVGRSVNWVPMEASMRGIQLVFLAELAELLPDPGIKERLRNLLFPMLVAHGEFVWRHREFTDNRGNHYAANIVALLLIGAHLGDRNRAARTWFDHAASGVPREIEAQFYSDGVNFEKSVGYHRLVTELFVLSALCLRSVGRPLSSGPLAVLQHACEYTAACRRPDGTAVNAGDCDDSLALTFDPLATNEHSALIDVGATIFGGPTPTATQPSLAAAWLCEPPHRGSPRKDSSGLQYFQEGGLATWRAGGDHIWIDIGEVGQNGLGGHGHNDLLSFDLSLNGEPLIVDPGTYYYTGDLAARTWFRGTSAHNGVQIDGEELAPLLGDWRISNAAQPIDVRCEASPTGFSVSAGHTGYRRLRDGVVHHRDFVLEAEPFLLRIVDRFQCRERHRVERRLHLVPDARIALDGGRAIVTRGHHRYYVSWTGSEASIERGWVSRFYSHREEAPVLVLRDEVDGSNHLTLTIEKGGLAQ